MGLGHVRNRILYNLVGGELEIKKMTGEPKLCFNMVQYMNSEILNEAQKNPVVLVLDIGLSMH